MARVSAKAVAEREKLARALLSKGATTDQVQAEMVKFDCGNGRTGVKMTPARMMELEREVKGVRTGATADNRIPGNSLGATPDAQGQGSDLERETETQADGLAAPPSARVVGHLHKPEAAPNIQRMVMDDGREDGSFFPATAFQDGSIPVARCEPGTTYTTRSKDGDGPVARAGLTGKFTGQEKGLYCFAMDDGRVFKLWADERVLITERGTP